MDSSCNVREGFSRALIFLSRLSQRCSIGLRSGLRGGHSKTLILEAKSYCRTTFAMCGRALSCIKTNPGRCMAPNGSTTGAIMSSLYLTAVIEPLFTTTKLVRSSKVIPPQTITDPPPNRSTSCMAH
jgi:hypothetical protein